MAHSIIRYPYLRRTGLTALALLAALASSPAATSAPAPREEAGLYLYIAHPELPKFAAAYSPSLAKNYIDGAAIMVKWEQIEPRPEAYDWSVLDRWIKETVLLHKRLSIGVIAGSFTPAWLYGPGYEVPKISFEENGSSPLNRPVSMTQPAFWHPVYLLEYGKMMTELARHLHSLEIPGLPSTAVYQAVRSVKLSGINNTTEELKVDCPKPDNGPTKPSAITTTWVQAGFTPGKVLAAFMTLAAETRQAFPDKILSVAIIHRSAFPPIDDNGNITPTVPIPDSLTAKIMAAAVPLYGDRLLVQWNALWQGPPPPEVLAAGKKGARIGWQMNGFMGAWGGSGYIYPNWKLGPCQTPAQFQSILDNGFNLGGQYIEVQVGSVFGQPWDSVFQAAHDRLWSGAMPDGR